MYVDKKAMIRNRYNRIPHRLPAKNDPAPRPPGNFADIIYVKEQSFLHRIRDVCTLKKLGRNIVTAI